MDLVILGLDIILLFILLFLIFKLVIKEIRSICETVKGYIKFGQLSFLILSIMIFLIIFLRSIFYPEFVSKTDVFLTIVVGFLGTMLGYFFKESTLDILEAQRKGASLKWLNQIELMEKVINKQKIIIHKIYSKKLKKK